MSALICKIKQVINSINLPLKFIHASHYCIGESQRAELTCTSAKFPCDHEKILTPWRQASNQIELMIPQNTVGLCASQKLFLRITLQIYHYSNYSCIGINKVYEV